MKESNLFNNLKIFEDDFDEDLLQYPRYCILLLKPFDNVMRIDLTKTEDFMNCIIHLQKQHPDRYFTDFAHYKIDLTQPGEYHSIIRQMGYLYYIEFEVKNNTVYLTVHMLNVSKPLDKFKMFTVEFKQQRSLVKEQHVRYKGLGHIYTLQFKVSDLSIVGDVTQAEVFINIDHYILCSSCTLVKKYSEGRKLFNDAWCCFQCDKINEYCNSADIFGPYFQCYYEEYIIKQQKHAHFFCPFQTKCCICQKNMYEKSFVLHYQKRHQDITYKIGENIRIEKTSGSYCLLQYSDDTFIVVWYQLNSEELQVAIRTPWYHANLDRYTCFVTVSTQEQTETFPMYPLEYNVYDDWKLRVGTWIFKKWDTQFIVSVYVQHTDVRSETPIGDDSQNEIID